VGLPSASQEFVREILFIGQPLAKFPAMEI